MRRPGRFWHLAVPFFVASLVLVVILSLSACGRRPREGPSSEEELARKILVQAVEKSNSSGGYGFEGRILQHGRLLSTISGVASGRDVSLTATAGGRTVEITRVAGRGYERLLPGGPWRTFEAAAASTDTPEPVAFDALLAAESVSTLETARDPESNGRVLELSFEPGPSSGAVLRGAGDRRVTGRVDIGQEGTITRVVLAAEDLGLMSDIVYRDYGARPPLLPPAL